MMVTSPFKRRVKDYQLIFNIMHGTKEQREQFVDRYKYLFDQFKHEQPALWGNKPNKYGVLPLVKEIYNHMINELGFSPKCRAINSVYKLYKIYYYKYIKTTTY